MKPKIIYFSWMISLIATMGSLYFSNVMMLPPCSLCWWQRVFMYPLAILFSVAFIRRDAVAIWYTTPLVIAGWIVSIYHNLLYYGVIPKSITACSAGVSCTSKQIEWLGFITIPLLSFCAFTLLSILTIYTIIKSRNLK